jgi:phenylacetate-CoA ligase
VELGTALAGAIKSNIGVTCAVDVMPPGTVERSVGKAKRVVDTRPSLS